MGYFEIYCIFCGVPFVMRRGRLDGEENQEQEPCIGEMADNPSLDGSSIGDDYDPCGGSSHYCGHRITEEELERFRPAQCLVLKTEVDDWTPEADDQDFELSSDFFLSSYAETEMNMVDYREPFRHGLDSGTAIYSIDFDDEDREDPIPFHPSCFKIFDRISRQRLGCVDVNGLWHWSKTEVTFDYFHSTFPRHPAVSESQEQDWNHQHGQEWLAADPLYIPKLSNLLELLVAFQNDGDTFYGTEQDEKGSLDLVTKPPDRGPLRNRLLRLPGDRPIRNDFFELLPQDIFYMILYYLPSRDVANLRLVTPAAVCIPKGLFRSFVKTELPWFWEADALPRDIDWARLYFAVKFKWSEELRGLKNRKRIWKDINLVVDRIQALWPTREIPQAMDVS